MLRSQYLFGSVPITSPYKTQVNRMPSAASALNMLECDQVQFSAAAKNRVHLKFGSVPVVPNQKNLQDPELAKAGCGLIAAHIFSQVMEKGYTLPEIKAQAKHLALWDPENGMNPTKTHDEQKGMNWGEPLPRLLKHLGIPVEWEQKIDWTKVKASIKDEELPVILRRRGHYLVAMKYRESDGRFYFGTTAKAFKNLSVPEWMTPEEFEKNIPFIPDKNGKLDTLEYSYYLRPDFASNGVYRPPIVYQHKDKETGKESPCSDDRFVKGSLTNHQPIFVIHETMGTYGNAVGNFSGQRKKGQVTVSTHALIDRDGEIRFFVPPNQAAWASGESEYKHEGTVEREPREAMRNGQPTYSVNKFAIQVELVTPDDGRNPDASMGVKESHSGYTENQYRSLAWLLALTQIPSDRITYHRAVDATPGHRKYFCPRDFDEGKLLEYRGQMQTAMPPINIFDVSTWKELVELWDARQEHGKKKSANLL